MPPRFRLTAPVQPEQELHEAVAALLTKIILPPAEWAHYPAGSIQLTDQQQAKMMRMGLRRGFPDFLLWHEKSFGIELKRIGGRLSTTRLGRTKRGHLRVYEGQADMFPKLEAAGMIIAVCHSTDEVVAQLRVWGIPHREVT